jgi:hypothetical protein
MKLVRRELRAVVLAVVAFVIVQSVLYGWVYLAGFGILSLIDGSWYVGAALLIAAVLQRLVVYRVVSPRFEKWAEARARRKALPTD